MRSHDREFRRLRENSIDWKRNPPPITGADFRAWRELLGLSQEQLASLTGLARRTIQNWERGHETRYGRTYAVDVPPWGARLLYSWLCAKPELAPQLNLDWLLYWPDEGPADLVYMEDGAGPEDPPPGATER